jgi:hypothetical protein
MKFSSWAFAVLVAVVKFTPSFAAAPDTNPDFATTPLNVAVTIDVLLNDFNSNGDPFEITEQGTDVDKIDATSVMIGLNSVTTSSGPLTKTASPGVLGGTISVSPTTGKITFTPATNSTGTITFVYDVNDQGGGSVSTATPVTVTVRAAPFVDVNAYDTADALALTQNTLLNFGLRGSATSQAQFENAFFPVLDAPNSFFPVFNNDPIPQFTSPWNSVNANFAAVFANFGGLGGFFGN